MEVLLIRTAPGTVRDHEHLMRARCTSEALCFFHGDGVGHALDPETSRVWAETAEEGGLDLVVCETALARRSDRPVSPPWRAGSLAQFWQALSSSPFAHGGSGFLIRVRDTGDDRFKREALELCLAGAALEIEMAVCFSGAGLEQLRGPGAAPWRQFPDFELGPLYYVADRETSLGVPARRVDSREAARMAAKAGRVVDA